MQDNVNHAISSMNPNMNMRNIDNQIQNMNLGENSDNMLKDKASYPQETREDNSHNL